MFAFHYSVLGSYDGIISYCNIDGLIFSYNSIYFVELLKIDFSSWYYFVEDEHNFLI
jgi:hypothetical protein